MRKTLSIDSPYLLRQEELPYRENATVDWDVVFGRHVPLRIEIGVGNSPFLVEVGRLEPSFNYLGFEYSGKRVVKFLKKVERAGLGNIRMLKVNALPLLREIVAPGTVDHFFVNFPDPWPKRRHAKKRFVNPTNTRLVADLLRPGGGFSLRTDDPPYAGQMLEVLDGCPELSSTARRGHFTLEPRYGFPTPYELKFRAEGRTIYYLEYVKPPTPMGSQD